MRIGGTCYPKDMAAKRARYRLLPGSCLPVHCQDPVASTHAVSCYCPILKSYFHFRNHRQRTHHTQLLVPLTAIMVFPLGEIVNIMFTIHLELFVPLSERYITLYINDDVFHVYIVELEMATLKSGQTSVQLFFNNYKLSGQTHSSENTMTVTR